MYHFISHKIIWPVKVYSSQKHIMSQKKKKKRLYDFKSPFELGFSKVLESNENKRIQTYMCVHMCTQRDTSCVRIGICVCLINCNLEWLSDITGLSMQTHIMCTRVYTSEWKWKKTLYKPQIPNLLNRGYQSEINLLKQVRAYICLITCTLKS